MDAVRQIHGGDNVLADTVSGLEPTPSLNDVSWDDCVYPVLILYLIVFFFLI